MPAWMTSLLREEVSVPMAAWRSRRRVEEEGEWWVSSWAMARPTTPPPITAWVKSALVGRVWEKGRACWCWVCRRRAERGVLGADAAARTMEAGNLGAAGIVMGAVELKGWSRSLVDLSGSVCRDLV